MQQHTGQHLLSASFDKFYKAKTIGFHLGTEASTIDLDIPTLSWEQTFDVEQKVNAIVCDNKPVCIKYVSGDAINKIPLRKPPQVEGRIRVILINDYDASACGGTHVERTGEIGLIKVTGLARHKGGIRVTFLSGNRTLLAFQNTYRIVQLAGESLSVGQSEIPEAIARIQNELTAALKSFNQAQSLIVEFEADRLWTETPEVKGIRYVSSLWPKRSFKEIQRIASQLRKREKTLLLFAVIEEKGVRLVCARSDDLPTLDAQHILMIALDKLNGRGGGSPIMAQGGARTHSVDEIQDILNQLRASITTMIV
jgi:alanyl-tRNA synthetase